MKQSTESSLRDALEHASIPTLLMCLAQMTGEDCWLNPPFLPNKDVRLFADESGGLDVETQRTVRESAKQVLEALASGVRALPEAPNEDQLARMMNVCVAEPVPNEYVPLMMEEFGFAERDVQWSESVNKEALANFHVLIVGAGMSGICAAIKLEKLGISWSLVEKNADLGGTWIDNDYPESGVDTPNHFYSYSFAPNFHWSGYFSKRAEVWQYFRDVAESHRVYGHMQFNTTVSAMEWDESAGLWRVHLEGQNAEPRVVEANAVITAVGQLNRPKIPEVPGLESFEERCFHTAQWRHDVSLRDKRVAIIGTGASAMQILRTVAAQAEHVTIFQRSPQWVRPSTDYHRTVSLEVTWLLEHVPFYYQWYRFGLFWRFGDGLLKSLRRDPEWPHPERAVNRRNDRHRHQLTEYVLSELEGHEDLVPKVLPDYPPYGKRILVDNDWYRTLKRDNVTLIEGGLAAADTDSIVDTEGNTYPVDVLILATGFEAGQMLMPMKVQGRSGQLLQDAWVDDDPKAYKGVTVPDYPNLFCLFGPNSNLGHGGSVIFQTECQVKYVSACLVKMIENNLAAIEVKQDVHDLYNEKLDAEHAQLIWTHPGMTSWHRNARGRVFSTMPWRLVDYWNMTRQPDFENYILVERREVSAE